MKPPRTYASPESFKQALEQRLKTSSKSGADFARRRRPEILNDAVQYDGLRFRAECRLARQALW